MDCRPLEVQAAKIAIEKHNLVWLVAEDECGDDDFLTVVRHSQNYNLLPVYRLDLSSFVGLSDDLNSLQSIIAGGDVNRFCNQIGLIGKAYLILDKLAPPRNSPELAQNIIIGAEELAKVIIDCCPELMLVIRSSEKFAVGDIDPIIVRPLDEPEFKNYIELHHLSRNTFEEDISLGHLFAWTRGRPGSIDKLLKALASSSFESIANGSSDESIDEAASLPGALIDTIEQMREGNEYEQRKYRLLVALSFFRFGESVATIKYFGGRQKLRSGMTSELVDAGLVDVAEAQEFSSKKDDFDKVILIRPGVLAYLHKMLGEDAVREGYEAASEVYFGKDWRVGTVKINTAFRFASHRVLSNMEQNASLILARLISDSLEAEKDDHNHKNTLLRIEVFHSYLMRLVFSDKYFFAVRICQALLPKIRHYRDDRFVKSIVFNYGRGLRMLGEYSRAIEELEEVLSLKNTDRFNADVMVNLAYAYENSDQIDTAKELAEAVKDLRFKGGAKYHAEAILLGLSTDPRRLDELDTLAEKSRKDGHKVASNVIRMTVIEGIGDSSQKIKDYRKLAEQARKDGDTYNMMRAITNWMGIATKEGHDINEKDVDSLFSAYIYACSQRQRKMFYQSHAALWEVLEQSSNIERLLELFKHSSTLQRLTGKVNTELAYLKRLVKVVRKFDFNLLIKTCDHTWLWYYVSRASSYRLISSGQDRKQTLSKRANDRTAAAPDSP